ncbi:Uncharacterized protein BM_BM178 [Brugia malayi]|uniref:Bm178 n=1 Tax=Brugia malayi TaxID=6279 RepID=A0A0K0J333_BRUMA|nr:Bm178 [Brugia malayi]VIO87710.1 Uncharacterized protein BM_BM178 [Brugia malayi]
MRKLLVSKPNSKEKSIMKIKIIFRYILGLESELYLSRMKPEETLVRVRSDFDVQIDRLTLILGGQIELSSSSWLPLTFPSR